MIDIAAKLKENAAYVEKYLSQVFPPPDPDFGIVQEAESYSLMAGGKRIRPFLVLETAKLFGGNPLSARYLAAAVEMIHTYSLIHDDLPVMDDDELRRGKPTCHMVYGEANALLAGDALLTRAFFTVASAPDSLLPDSVKVKAIELLASAAGDCGMIAGQVMDLAAEEKDQSEMSIEALLKLHSLKTGALIRVSAELGAISAGILPGSPEMEAIVSYCESIGIAFQVIDDILDVIGDEALLGKPIGSDAEEGKITFLSYLSIEEAERFAVELTESAVSAIEPYDQEGVFRAFAYYLCNRNY